MNQRFKELMIESMIETGRLQDGVQASYQRFGEKVVRECIRHFNEDYQRDFDTLWREDLTNSIKNHFGVKE